MESQNCIYDRIRKHLKDVLEYYEDDVQDSDIMDFPQNEFPDWLDNEDAFKLYRYMPANYYSIRGLETQTIHLSENGKMNDIYEGVPSCLDADALNESVNFLHDMAYMCCFTESPTNVLMWSHYAEASKGICVEYDIKNLCNDPYKTKEHLFPMIYTDKRLIQAEIGELVKSHQALVESIKNNEVYWGDMELNDILPLFVTKGKEWEYEQEWRIVYTKKQLFDEFEDLLDTFICPFNCITGIYLGHRIGKGKKEHILEICKRMEQNGTYIPVYQMKLSEEYFKLIPQKIN